MCMNKHLLRGATMTELLSMAREDNRRLNGHDFLDAPRIMAHIHWCCEPQRGWLIDKNKHGVLRLVGYRGERDARIDAEHAEQKSFFPSGATSKEVQIPVPAQPVETPNVSATPKRVVVTTTAFVRDSDIVRAAKERALGICERCRQPAPFIRAVDQTPYLEGHHIVALSNGGSDSLDNVLALCPNCHRWFHHGVMADSR
jgi:5-methylcytosine-specific restriction endonuclease McrA